MDYPNGMAHGKPDFDPRDFDCLVSRSIVGMWFSIPLLGAILRAGRLHWPALHQEAYN